MVDVVIKSADGKSVGVDDDGKLEVFAIQETQLEHVSAAHGQGFAWYSSYAMGAANEEVMSIKNDSTTLLLHIDQVWIGGLIVAQWKIGYMTSGTPAGTTITGIPLNVDRAQTADATAFGNASVTGSIAIDTMSTILTVADDSKQVDLEGAWILGKDDVFVISGVIQDTCFATVIGHFDTEGV